MKKNVLFRTSIFSPFLNIKLKSKQESINNETQFVGLQIFELVAVVAIVGESDDEMKQQRLVLQLLLRLIDRHIATPPRLIHKSARKRLIA